MLLLAAPLAFLSLVDRRRCSQRGRCAKPRPVIEGFVGSAQKSKQQRANASQPKVSPAQSLRSSSCLSESGVQAANRTLQFAMGSRRLKARRMLETVPEVQGTDDPALLCYRQDVLSRLGRDDRKLGWHESPISGVLARRSSNSPTLNSSREPRQGRSDFPPGVSNDPAGGGCSPMEAAEESHPEADDVRAEWPVQNRCQRRFWLRSIVSICEARTASRADVQRSDRRPALTPARRTGRCMRTLKGSADRRQRPRRLLAGARRAGAGSQRRRGSCRRRNLGPPRDHRRSVDIIHTNA